LLAAIGDVIERHMVNIGFITDPKAERLDFTQKKMAVGQTGLRHCPKCGQPALVQQEGCDSCTSCGYSKCG